MSIYTDTLLHTNTIRSTSYGLQVQFVFVNDHTARNYEITHSSNLIPLFLAYMSYYKEGDYMQNPLIVTYNVETEEILALEWRNNRTR